MASEVCPLVGLLVEHLACNLITSAAYWFHAVLLVVTCCRLSTMISLIISHLRFDILLVQNVLFCYQLCKFVHFFC